MPSKADCVQAVIDGGLDRKDAVAVVDKMMKRKKQLKAEGGLNRATDELVDLLAKESEEAAIAAALNRKQVALTILKRKNVDGFISQVEGEGFHFLDAMEAMMVGSSKKFSGARNSVSRKMRGIQRRWQGGILSELEALDGPVQKLLLKDKSFQDDVARAMMEAENWEGKLAGQVAEVLGKYCEDARLRMNRAGANIGKLEGWIPQSHDQSKLLSKTLGGRSGWVDFVMERLDAERSFPDMEEDDVREALESVFDTISSGKDQKTNAKARGEHVGPANLARSMTKHRVLHFKSAEDFLQYHEAYGRGNVLDNVLGHLDMSSRKLALMDTFGPNPEVMLESLIEAEKLRVRGDVDAARSYVNFEKLRNIRQEMTEPQIKAHAEQRLNNAWSNGRVVSGKLAHWYAELNGETFGAVRPTAAKIASVTRAVMSMGKLGGATLSAVADVFVKAINARHHGNSLLDSWKTAFDMRFEGLSSEEQRRIYRSLGTMIDGTLGDLAARFEAQDSHLGSTSSHLNRFFKWSGLTAWTEANKAGYVHMLSTELGHVSGLIWEDLPEATRRILDWQGISMEKWEVLRYAASKEADGNTHLLPEKVWDLDDADIDPLIEHRLENFRGDDEQREAFQERLRTDMRRELETDLMGYYADETMYAIIEPDEKTRAAMVRGTRPGSGWGEAARFVTQFKSFPIAYIQRTMAGKRWKRADVDGLDLMGISHYVATSFIMGYLAMTAKDLSKGRTPRELVDKDGKINMGTASAALLQSGGAGIYGDFLLGKVNRFGGGFLGTIAGPVVSTASNIGVSINQLYTGEASKGRDGLIREALNNTPYLNLWYTRAAFDYMVGYHIREMISPGTIKRTQRRLKKEYGQESLLPLDNIKRGGGWR